MGVDETGGGEFSDKARRPTTLRTASSISLSILSVVQGPVVFRTFAARTDEVTVYVYFEPYLAFGLDMRVCQCRSPPKLQVPVAGHTTKVLPAFL